MRRFDELVRGGCFAGRGLFHRQCIVAGFFERYRVAAHAPANHQCFIERDARDPRAEFSGGLVAVEPGKGPQVGFLNGVLGGVGIAQNTARHAEQPAIVAAHQRFKRHEIVFAREFDQTVIGQIAQRPPGRGTVSGFLFDDRAHVVTMRPFAAPFPDQKEP